MIGEADLTEETLIERAKSGDRDAFCELVERYQQRIHALALHFTGNPAEAEDLSQEAWLKAFRSMRSFRGESGFYTWVRRIAINALLDSRKRWWWRAEPFDPQAAQFVYELPLETHLLLRNVWSHLAELSGGERMTVILRHVEGMTIEEIALARRTSAGTVKKTLHRAIAKLRARFDTAGDRGPFVPVPEKG